MALQSTSRIFASLLGAALLVALGVGLLFSTFRQMEDAGEARQATYVLLSDADALLSELRDAETGQRGYLLTGDEVFLTPYLAVRDKLDVHLAALRHQPLAPGAATHLENVARLMASKLSEMARVIDMRRNHDIAGATAKVIGGEGKMLMDAIRLEMREFDRTERQALAENDADFQQHLRQLLSILIGASGAALLAALLFAYLVYRETQHRLNAVVHTETMKVLAVEQIANQRLEEANATLRISEAKLAVTLNSIGDGVLATDADGRITLLNPVAEQLTGWLQAEAAGKSVDEVFHIINQETRALAAIPIQAALEHGAIQGLANHTVLISRDGTECAIADSCAPIRGIDNAVVGAVLVFRDVTEEYAVRQALNDKNVQLENATLLAEQANLAKSDFLSSMSHELRTPLNAILGFAQLLESDVPPLTAVQMQNIGQILQAGWHLLLLINEILDLAKVESGKMPLSREPVLLSEVLAESRSMVESRAIQRGIRMAFPPDDLPFFVHADRMRVKQVLINLLTNAIKYNVPKGSVEVQCVETAPGRIRVRIADTGAGLAPDLLAQLFQPFNRLGRETEGDEGTGIGLVVAKRLVELMGGTIGVESLVGVGTVFWFELLSAAEPELFTEAGIVDLPIQAHQAPSGRVHTLLAIEDNPANLRLVEQLIARYPTLRMLTAVNGIRGVEMARYAQPDVILMDINLPGIDGYEALRLLRADPATASIPVIAVSANAMPFDVARGLQAGFFRYVTKPIKVTEFVEAIELALEMAKERDRGGMGTRPAQ